MKYTYKNFQSSKISPLKFIEQFKNPLDNPPILTQHISNRKPRTISKSIHRNKNQLAIPESNTTERRRASFPIFAQKRSTRQWAGPRPHRAPHWPPGRASRPAIGRRHAWASRGAGLRVGRGLRAGAGCSLTPIVPVEVAVVVVARMTFCCYYCCWQCFQWFSVRLYPCFSSVCCFRVVVQK